MDFCLSLIFLVFLSFGIFGFLDKLVGFFEVVVFVDGVNRRRRLGVGYVVYFGIDLGFVVLI